jgi:predicted transcriptional regulator
MKGKREVDALRAELAGIERRGRGHRYPPELRKRVTAYAVAHHADGTTPREIGDELGMDSRTVERWLEKEHVSGFEQLIVQQDAHAPAGRLVVHGPGGVRIEGLDLDALAELLRKLT